MNTNAHLPPGQKEIGYLPRFGLTKFARRHPPIPNAIKLAVYGDIAETWTLTQNDLDSLSRISQRSDFHCVTTWSTRNLLWSGYRFSEVMEKIIEPKSKISRNIHWVIFYSLDGYRAEMWLKDLLKEDVLLATHLNGSPLNADHGAPLRLIAPAHYGYKNAKHIKAIEFRRDLAGFRPPAFRFMDHPRARVAEEERGRWIPGPLLRWLYRPLIKPTIALFKKTRRR